MTFKEQVTSILEEVSAGVYRCKLSDEQRKSLQAVQTAMTASTIAGISGTTVSSLEIAAAINARVEGGSATNASGIYADEICMKTAKGENRVYPCAVSKATNICTSLLEEASVLKMYARCRITQSSRGVAAKSFIRKPNENPFSKAEIQDSSKIIKKTSMRDTELSCTVFPGDIRYVDELNKLINACNNLKMQMTAQFIESCRSNIDDDRLLLTLYRNINRSMAEDIFETQYQMSFGNVDDGDPASVAQYLDTRSIYMQSLATIGAMYLSSESADFGLAIRQMTISPRVVWRNNAKMGKIRQFNGGSYYVSSNTDYLIGQIPTSLEIVAEHEDEIVSLTDAAMSLLENEVRKENGLEPAGSIIIPEVKVYTGPREYNKILGINEDKEREILAELSEQMQNRAKETCESKVTNDSAKKLEAYNKLMGGN